MVNWPCSDHSSVLELIAMLNYNIPLSVFDVDIEHLDCFVHFTGKNLGSKFAWF